MRAFHVVIFFMSVLSTLALAQSQDSAGQQNKVCGRESKVCKEAMEQLVTNHQRDLNELYAPLLDSERLQQDEKEEVTRLLAEHQFLTNGWSASSGSGYVQHSPGPEDHQRARERMLRVEAILGREAFSQLEQYKDTLPERWLVRTLNRRLSAAGSSFSATQIERLVPIIAAERYRKNPALLNHPQQTVEHAREFFALLINYERHVKRVIAPEVTSAQRAVVADYFQDRERRVNEALSRYLLGVANGESPALVYPVD